MSMLTGPAPGRSAMMLEQGYSIQVLIMFQIDETKQIQTDYY